MFIINERRGKLSNFIVPSMIAALGALLLSFLYNFIFFILIVFNVSFEGDILILSLIMTFISQIIGTLIVSLLIIPILKLKEVEKSAFNFQNLYKTLVLICLIFAINTISNYFFIFIFNLFNLIPQSGYSGFLLNAEQISNPFNIIIYYLPPTIGAPLFEELLYRRSIIPLLEKRGMNSLTAVVSSSIIFAMGHLPNDLVNGNLYGGIIHCVGVFYLSLSFGFIYVLTRNILFPIIIHSFVNFISFSSPLLITLQNEFLLLSYNILVWSIVIIGLGIIGYIIWRYFKRRSTDWVIILRSKFSQDAKPGIYIFLLIGISSAFLPLIIDLFSTKVLIQTNNIILYLTILLVSYSISIGIFFWLSICAKFEFNKNYERQEV